LFQHHTTDALAASHGMIGLPKSYHTLANLGPNWTFWGVDNRSERNMTQVCSRETWDLMFEQLHALPHTPRHLFVVFPVPFSYFRLRAGEKVLGTAAKAKKENKRKWWLRWANSIFDLPELYDDLLDEWCHGDHLTERNWLLEQFQDFAQSRGTRITFLSGDVHCCGMSRFSATRSAKLTAETDAKLMYQVISSAIVNQPPPRMLLQFYQLWFPVRHLNLNGSTKEGWVRMFSRRPEGGRRISCDRLLPNRNWTFIEDCSGGSHEVIRTERYYRHGVLGPTSGDNGLGARDSPIHKHSRKGSCHRKHLTSDEFTGQGSLRLRIWLESRQVLAHGRKFVSYEVIVPKLSSHVDTILPSLTRKQDVVSQSLEAFESTTITSADGITETTLRTRKEAVSELIASPPITHEYI